MEELHVGLESIQYQFEDTDFINHLETEYKSLLKIYKQKKPISSKAFMELDTVKDHFNHVDTILEDRYGLNFNHISGPSVGYAVTPIQPESVSVIAGDIRAKVESLKEGSKGAKDGELPKDIMKDGKEFYNTMLTSHKIMNKVLNTKGVTIDEKRAKIFGLPKTFKLLLVVDLPQLFSLDSTPLEVIAFLLHEVGHAFTHISESYRSVQISNNLMEILKEGDIPNARRFKLMSKTIHNVDTSGNKPEVILLNFHSEALRMVKPLNPHDTQHHVESERLADEFAIRFGLGRELGTGLAKITGKTVKLTMPEILGLTLYLTSMFIGISMTMGFTLTAIGYLSVAFVYILLRMISGTEKNEVKIYDRPKERLSRIIRGEVNVLRNLPKDINEDVKDLQVEKIEALKKVYKETPSDKVFGDILIEKLPWFSGSTNDTDRNRSIEILTENLLHAQAHRLEAINNKLR